MSKHLQPCLYTGKALEQQWINLIHGSHDLCCGCPSAFDHLKEIIKNQECLSTEKEETTTGEIAENIGENFGIDEGDLEKLFNLTDDADG